MFVTNWFRTSQTVHVNEILRKYNKQQKKAGQGGVEVLVTYISDASARVETIKTAITIYVLCGKGVLQTVI